MTGTQDWEAEKAEREAAWWRRWWGAKFHWKALGGRKEDGAPVKAWRGWSITDDGKCVETQSAVGGSIPATLQDYFRWDPDAKRLRTDEELIEAGLLVRKSGQRDFHILHLPQTYKDGRPTWKANLKAEEWADFEGEIARLLSRSGETDKAIDLGGCTSADHRAQLHGAVLRHFPRPTTHEDDANLHLIADLSAFLTHANGRDLEFGSPARFFRALFCSSVSFHSAKFSGGGADFQTTQFSGGNASFSHAEFSGGNADFIHAMFASRASFRRAQFSGGDTYFYRAKFSGGDADFRGAEFSGGNADFVGVKFSGGYANFNSAKFSGGARDFRDARFDNVVFDDAANFVDTTFSGDASFRGARFLEACEFGRSDQPYARQPRPGARFLGRLNLRGASFEGLADFSRVRFPEKTEDRNSAFEGARFFEPLDLKGVETLPFSAFHGIRLDKGILLDSQHPEPDQFEQALHDAEAAIARDETEDRSGHEAERSGADKRYAALEAGCRALKEAMAADGDRKREQEFFSHELAARERRLQHRLADLKAEPKGAPARRKIGPARADLMASQLYKHLSGYGGSILRPLAALGAVSLAVGAGLLALMLGFSLGESAPTAGLCLGLDCGPTLHPVVTDTLDALIRGALGPFRLLAGPGQPFAYLGDSAPVFRSMVGGIMLVHGLISSALIFLCLLALRRQFQIN